jgi:hypothetical protein
VISTSDNLFEKKSASNSANVEIKNIKAKLISNRKPETNEIEEKPIVPINRALSKWSPFFINEFMTPDSPIGITPVEKNPKKINEMNLGIKPGRK